MTLAGAVIITFSNNETSLLYFLINGVHIIQFVCVLLLLQGCLSLAHAASGYMYMHPVFVLQEI